jgi:hypothetical protein
MKGTKLWIRLGQHRIQWRPLVSMVMKLLSRSSASAIKPVHQDGRYSGIKKGAKDVYGLSAPD